MESLQNIILKHEITQGSKITVKVWGYNKERILFESLIVQNKIKSSYVSSKTIQEIIKEIEKK